MTSRTPFSASTRTFPVISADGFTVIHQSMAMSQSTAVHSIDSVNSPTCCSGGVS